jgi:NAD+ synthase
MNSKQKIKHIVEWLRTYAKQNKISTFVVGISGGIDSSVVSTLCAETGITTIAVQMPIHQDPNLHNRSSMHAKWLLDRYSDVVIHVSLNLTEIFDVFAHKLDWVSRNSDSAELAFANSKSRLRMMTLYQIAQCRNGLVVGTGNKVEDFGVGFFTKYGDGGVDLSPIGDCLKTEVWDMGRELGILKEIIEAAPTDGLWSDRRTDEDQLGMSYQELERAMQNDPLACESGYETPAHDLDKTEWAQLKKYREIRARNMHKMLPIPVCKIN